MSEKGFIDDTNVFMSSKRLKYFDYSGDIDDEKDKLDITPTEEFKVKFHVINEFVKFLKKLDRISLRIIRDEDWVKLEDGDGTISYKVSVGTDTTTLTKCRFSVEYLYNFFRNYKFKKSELDKQEITIKLEEDYPLYLEINGDWGILAPRVEAE